MSRPQSPPAGSLSMSGLKGHERLPLFQRDREAVSARSLRDFQGVALLKARGNAGIQDQSVISDDRLVSNPIRLGVKAIDAVCLSDGWTSLAGFVLRDRHHHRSAALVGCFRDDSDGREQSAVS